MSSGVFSIVSDDTPSRSVINEALAKAEFFMPSGRFEDLGEVRRHLKRPFENTDDFGLDASLDG